MTDTKEVSMSEQIGLMAGEVWHRLDRDGPQTLAKLKKGLNASSELLAFALDLLAREDRVEILIEKKVFLVRLKLDSIRQPCGLHNIAKQS
jgi:hypothetical protein